MSKRLQVLLSDEEMIQIQRLGRRERITVGEWVRRVLREARRQKPSSDPEVKLKAVRRGVELCFPTADIEQMNREIERAINPDLYRLKSPDVPHRCAAREQE